MFKNTFFFLVIIAIFSIHCKTKITPSNNQTSAKSVEIKTKETKEAKIVKTQVAASRFKQYIGILKGKKVGVIANQGSVIFNPNTQKYVHLVDTLLSLNIDVVKVFSPEHGFRGTADAGELVKDDIDPKTGLKLISLYGENKKPKSAQLSDVDVLLFDLQDVGVRFYTYISTLHYVMEAAAENNKPLILLDRPNPNIQYVDGPVLDIKQKSFVGMHPVPVVYGMSIGEYAQMINGEKWLEKGVLCNLKVVKNKNYTHQTDYVLPIKPSPNLPNDKSINLYPSLCLFEGTKLSCGRGTEKQFQIFGSPVLPTEIYSFQFTPQPNFGSKEPVLQGETCYGLNLENHLDLNYFNLDWILEAYKNYPKKDDFFNKFFNNLAGNKVLKTQIESGLSSEEIKKTWQPQLDLFKKTRSKYLLYP